MHTTSQATYSSLTQTRSMNLALFDFDGTITTHETFPDFVRGSVSRPRLLFGNLILAPLIAGYKLGWVSGSAVRSAIVRFGYRGVALADVEAFGNAFAQTYLPKTLRPEVLQRIAWHQAQGDTVVVVSGGFDVYLSHWCREHAVDLICSSFEHHDGVLTGRYAGAQCVRMEKSRRVRERYDLSAYHEVFAYGDTREDNELLALATRRFYRGQELHPR